MAERRFADHFSAVASGYAAHRPVYPDALFASLTALAERPGTAWDVGCGSGQASIGLAAHVERVWATDASAAQLAHAPPHPRITYRVAPAEASGLDAQRVDLVLAAQCAHWFDLPRFYDEVRRVARPGAPVMLVGYRLVEVDEAVDAWVRRFAEDEVGPYWPAERARVEDAYRSLPFPFPELDFPRIVMRAAWTADDLLAYLSTWSSVRRCLAATSVDPVARCAPTLRAAWGPDRTREVRWTLFGRLGRVG